MARRVPASVTARLAALLILASGCSAVQYVQFEGPAGVEVRRPAADGGNESGPGTWPVLAGRVYACRIRFDRETLSSLGFADAEIDVLERERHLTLHGGLVALAGGEVGQTLLLNVDAATVRAALLHDRVAVTWGTDVRGNTRVLLKVSVGGVPLDDPDLTVHANRGGDGVAVSVADLVLEVLVKVLCQ